MSDDLRQAAERLLRRRQEQVTDPPPSDEEKREEKPKARRSAAQLVTGGASTAALIGVVVQMMQARVTPAQLTAVTERVQAIETQAVERRNVEYERDMIENCRARQLEDAVRQMLPRADQMGVPTPKPWFDRCPEMPRPTTGSKLPRPAE